MPAVKTIRDSLDSDLPETTAIKVVGTKKPTSVATKKVTPKPTKKTTPKPTVKPTPQENMDIYKRRHEISQELKLQDLAQL